MHTHTCIFVCTHVCMYVCMYACISIYIGVYPVLCRYVCRRDRGFRDVHLATCLFSSPVYGYIYIYIYKGKFVAYICMYLNGICRASVEI